jgi:16S rRNA C1402 (ribose-2'-O) methylase RsmI
LVRTSQQPARGEITLLIGAATTNEANQPVNTSPLHARVEQIIREQSLDRKSALKLAARERGLTKREAYKQLLVDR